MATKNKFAIHAAKYLREALKRASKTYKRGVRPRKAVITSLQKKRNDLNAKIRAEKRRGQ